MLGRANPNVLIAAALVAFLGVLGGLLGLYVLAPNRPNVAPLFSAIPGGLAFVVAVIVQRVQSGHSKQLATITHQTNGVLTEKIQDAVSSSVAATVPAALEALLSAHLAPAATATPVATITPAPAPDAAPPAYVPAVSTGA